MISKNKRQIKFKTIAQQFFHHQHKLKLYKTKALKISFHIYAYKNQILKTYKQSQTKKNKLNLCYSFYFYINIVHKSPRTLNITKLTFGINKMYVELYQQIVEF